MTRSTTTPTKAEKERLDTLSKLPCLCCAVLGKRQPSRTEIHHLVDKGTRALSGGHMATIPLCSWHHRGVPKRSKRPSDMPNEYGPSMELQKKSFELRFGSQRDLLKRTNALLKSLAQSDE